MTGIVLNTKGNLQGPGAEPLAGVVPGNPLTIVTVSYNSRTCLHLGWELMSALNPPDDIAWTIIENSPPESLERLDASDRRFRTVPGTVNAYTGNGRGSYHHAEGLNASLRLARARYLLFLDPDFFVIRPGWIRETIAHMEQHRLAFFGAPYFPARSDKYRYFPCGIFMFFDLEQVPADTLQFAPEVKEFKSIRNLGTRDLIAWLATGRAPAGAEFPQAPRGMLGAALRVKLLTKLLGRLPGLFMVKESRDVGIDVFRRYAGRPGFPSECLVPVWDNPLFSEASRGSLGDTLRKAFIRMAVPDGLSPYPKRKGTASPRSFKDFGLPDLAAMGWEEYLWKGEPFGFHVSGLFQGKTSVSNQDLASLIRTFRERSR